MELGTYEIAQLLRKRALDHDKKRVLMAKFTGSRQETDLTIPPNCHGFGRVHHFRRQPSSNWIENPLPIDPVSHFFGSEPENILQAQIFQLSVCDYRCWYCFVDDQLLSGNLKFSEMVEPRYLLSQVKENLTIPRVIVLSGGQPDLVPEYQLWFLDARRELGMEESHYLWIDDNLSTDFLWEILTEVELERMTSSVGIARVGCLKGFDNESFSFNTSSSEELFSPQIDRLAKLVRAGFDQYGYITLTTPNQNQLQSKIARLIDKIQREIHPNFPLRIVPLQIFSYNVNANSFQREAEKNQFIALEMWQRELEVCYSSEERTMRISNIKIRS